MAWSVLQEAKAASQPSSGNNVATYSTANLTAGTKLVAWISVSSSAGTEPVTSIKDGAGNTFTKGFSKENSATDGWVEMYFLDTPAGDVGTKPTITATLTTNFGSAMIIQEVSGLLAGNTTACLDGTAGLNTGSSTGPATSGAYSSTAANEWLAFAAGDPGFSITFATPATGYTASAQNTNASALANLEVGWKNSGNGAETGSSTFTGGTSDWATGLVAFKLAATAAGGVTQAQPGKTWQRRFHHRQYLPPPFIAAAAATAVTAAPQRPPITSRPRSRARIGPRGLCAAGIAVAAAVSIAPAERVPPPRHAPPARARIGPQGRSGAGIASQVVTPLGTPSRPRPFVFRSPAPQRGRWHGNAGPQPVTVVVTAYQRPPPQARRPAPGRAAWRGGAGPQPAVVAAVAYQRPPVIRRPAPRRALWRGFGSKVVTPLGTPGPLWRPQPRRPAPGRVTWRGGAGPQATVPPAPQAYQRPPPQARRPAARRVLWRSGIGPANPAPVVTGVPHPLPLPRSKAPRRALWRGNAGPQPAAVTATPPPRSRPLLPRRKPGRAVWRYILGLVNLTPPPFTIGQLTAADRAAAALAALQSAAALTAAGQPAAALTTNLTLLSMLTATADAAATGHGTSSDKPAATLTAASARTGGPGG